MNKSDRGFYMAVAAIVIIIVGGYAGLMAYTGFSSPFSVVTSQSMQHDQTESHLGCIDTGDMVIVQKPSKADIHSYMEGLQDGYRSFGDYGSVIIYERGDNKNPVIHRAILWLDYDPISDTWSSPQLESFDEEIWHTDKGSSWQNLEGTLYLTGITESKKNVHINLDTLPQKSGYLTMGDNSVSNNYLDQTAGIVSHLVGMDDIRSVAIFEVPWIGCVKLLVNGSPNLKYVENSIPSLIMTFISIFLVLLMFDIASLYKNYKNASKTIVRIESYRK